MKTKKIGKWKQKIIISLVIVIMTFTWIMPTYSQAGFWSKMGGTLLEPVCDLLAAIGDVANNLIAKTAGLKTNIFFDGSTSAGGWTKIQNEYCEGRSTRESIQNYYGGTLREKVIKVGSYDPDEAMEGGFDYITKANIVCPNFKITPIEIFAGRVALLDANFFQEIDDDYKSRMIGAGEVGDNSDNGNSTVANLKETISTWYQALRLIAIVGLLSVLVYVGLRMVTSAVATDKAKYKEMFVDWVIALCLVFFLHYIMVFTMTMVQEIQNLFVAGPTTSTNNKANKKTINTILLYFDGFSLENSSKADTSDMPKDSDTGNFDIEVPETPSTTTAENESTGIAIPTNLIGYNRVLVGNPDAGPKLTYTIMYLALTFYTIYFFFIYIKRVIILTFLTIIAPLVALTYPIDKVKDSKAQAFEFWLREYIVNAMIPIVHLILYTVLVSSALDLAVKSPLYAICVLAFIVPAEKIVKEMFGIKSSTTPALGGFAGGAMAAQMVQKLGKGKGKEKGKDGGSDKIRTKDDKNTTDPSLIEGDGLDALAGGNVRMNDGGQARNTHQQTAGNQAQGQQAQRNSQAQAQQAQRSAQAQGQQGASHSQAGGVVQQSRGNRNTGSRRRNLENMLRRKYNLPRGKTGKTLLKRAAKGIGKGYLRGAALIGGAAIGLAGGIVGGDMNDMWKGLAVGGIAGKQIGDNLSTGVENLVGTARQDYNEVMYGEDEANNMFADQEFINDVANREHVAAKIEEEHPEMERADVNEELEKRMQEYAKYRRAGITDIKEMDRLHKVQASLMPTEEQRNNMTAEEQEQERANVEAQTLEIAKLSTHYTADTFRDAGKNEKAIKALAQRFRAKGLPKDRSSALAEDTMAKIRKIKGEA